MTQLRVLHMGLAIAGCFFGCTPGTDPGSDDSDLPDTESPSSTDTEEPADTDVEPDPVPDPSVQPPVLLTISVHGHNYGFTEQQAAMPTWLTMKSGRYERDKTEIEWVAALAESVGGGANIQLNGEYCADATRLGDTAHLLDLEARGHVLGSHFHMYEAGPNHFWPPVSQSSATEGDLRQIFADHIDACTAALGHDLFRIDPAIGGAGIDGEPLLNELKSDAGVSVEPGGEAFSYAGWNHNPLNPFRRAEGSKLSEDPARPIAAMAAMGQVGQLVPAGKHQVMTTAAQIERQFLVVLAQRRAAALAGDPPRIWQLGIMTHPFENQEYQEEMSNLVAWLDTFTDDGTATFGTDRDVMDALTSWEAANPGMSSFSFDFEGWLGGAEVPYPYRAEGLTLALLDSEVVNTLELAGLRGYELRHREVTRGPANAEGVRTLTIGDATLPLFMLWAEGDSVVVDMSDRLGTGATAMAADGSTRGVDPAAVEVDSLGLVLTDHPEIWSP